MPGRTKKELQDIAYGIVLEKEWQTYQSLAKNIALDAYSYSFETHVFYDARDTEDRRQMLNLYSDGINPLNVIAITNISNRPPLYTDIAKKPTPSSRVVLYHLLGVGLRSVDFTPISQLPLTMVFLTQKYLLRLKNTNKYARSACHLMPCRTFSRRSSQRAHPAVPACGWCGGWLSRT